MVDEVSSLSEETAAEATNVSSASEEQAASIDSVSGNVQEMADLAAELDRLVDQFEVDNGAASDRDSTELASTNADELDTAAPAAGADGESQASADGGWAESDAASED